MNCRRAKRLLLEYVDGVLGKAEATEVGEHLHACTSCAGAADRLSESRAALDTLERKTISEEVTKRLLSTVDEGSFHYPLSRSVVDRFFRSPRTMTAAGGVLALLISLVVFIGFFSSDGNEKAPSSVAAGQTDRDGRPTQAGDISAEGARTGTEAQDTGVTETGRNELLLPVASVTSTNYSSESAEMMAQNLEIVDLFASRYTLADAIRMGSNFRRYLAEQLQSSGGDGPMLEAMIAYIESGEPGLLPCYAEQAQFNDEHVIIIGLCGPKRASSSTCLDRCEFWALSPARFENNPEASLAWWGQKLVVRDQNNGQ